MFPEYQLTSEDLAVGAKQLKEIKKQKVKDIRHKLVTPSTVKIEQQFYVVVPTAKAHENFMRPVVLLCLHSVCIQSWLKKFMSWLWKELPIHKK